jgi:hypothetical protein
MPHSTDSRDEFNIKCRSCNAKSIAMAELENYLVRKFNLKVINLESTPADYLCVVRFTRRKHGQYMNICIKPGEKPDEDVEGCLAKLKPKRIAYFNGIFYLF